MAWPVLAKNEMVNHINQRFPGADRIGPGVGPRLSLREKCRQRYAALASIVSGDALAPVQNCRDLVTEYLRKRRKGLRIPSLDDNYWIRNYASNQSYN
jgi:hypothetical protein